MSYNYENLDRQEVCPALGYQDVNVGVPVEVKPYAKIGKIKTDDSVGSGFFIRLRSSQEELYCLMTNEHVITKRMVLLMKPF